MRPVRTIQKKHSDRGIASHRHMSLLLPEGGPDSVAKHFYIRTKYIFTYFFYFLSRHKLLLITHFELFTKCIDVSGRRLHKLVRYLISIALP